MTQLKQRIVKVKIGAQNAFGYADDISLLQQKQICEPEG